MDNKLATYAVHEKSSKGRVFKITKAVDRNEFQRDYTRILHSQSFRKLQGKTQVFSSYLGRQCITTNRHSTFRTRMSHSFEVEQVSRSIARALGLNQDLCATLAIGHDIGHTPFGHMGQDILNDEFESIGGFEHNYQALRLVDKVESPYLEHEGLNLMFETREGLLKHCTIERAKKLGDVAKRHLTCTSPPLEVQVVDIADQIAYLYADLEDAVDFGLLEPLFLMENLPAFEKYWKNIETNSRPLPTIKQNMVINSHAKAAINEVWRSMLSDSLLDVIEQSKKNISDFSIETLDDVRQSHPLINLSDERKSFHNYIKKFSREHIYGNPKILKKRKEERMALEDLCKSLKSNPSDWGFEKGDLTSALDFISGLTDADVMTWHKKHLLENKALSSNNSKRRLSVVK